MFKEEEKTRVFIKFVLGKEEFVSNKEKTLMDVEDNAMKLFRSNV
jgi:hypothetical protein